MCKTETKTHREEKKSGGNRKDAWKNSKIVLISSERVENILFRNQEINMCKIIQRANTSFKN